MTEEPTLKRAKTSLVTQHKPRRRLSLVFGFCGFSYCGLQYQHEVPTIEGEIFRALVKIPGVFQGDDNPQFKRIGCSRSGRTDKGVHSVGSVISVSICEVPLLVQKLNIELPKDIKCFGQLRVSNSFSARKNCMWREYRYVFTRDLVDWKTEGTIEMLNALAARFVGTFHFHNFSEGFDYNDAVAVRTISQCGFLESNRDDILFFRIIGNSFILYQIRDMEGCVIDAALRTKQDCPRWPKAHADGLILWQSDYTEFCRIRKMEKQSEAYNFERTRSERPDNHFQLLLTLRTSYFYDLVLPQIESRTEERLAYLGEVDSFEIGDLKELSLKEVERQRLIKERTVTLET